MLVTTACLELAYEVVVLTGDMWHLPREPARHKLNVPIYGLDPRQLWTTGARGSGLSNPGDELIRPADPKRYMLHVPSTSRSSQLIGKQNILMIWALDDGNNTVFSHTLPTMLATREM